MRRREMLAVAGAAGALAAGNLASCTPSHAAAEDPVLILERRWKAAWDAFAEASKREPERKDYPSCEAWKEAGAKWWKEVKPVADIRDDTEDEIAETEATTLAGIRAKLGFIDRGGHLDDTGYEDMLLSAMDDLERMATNA